MKKLLTLTFLIVAIVVTSAKFAQADKNDEIKTPASAIYETFKVPPSDFCGIETNDIEAKLACDSEREKYKEKYMNARAHYLDCQKAAKGTLTEKANRNIIKSWQARTACYVPGSIKILLEDTTRTPPPKVDSNKFALSEACRKIKSDVIADLVGFESNYCTLRFGTNTIKPAVSYSGETSETSKSRLDYCYKLQLNLMNAEDSLKTNKCPKVMPVPCLSLGNIPFAACLKKTIIDRHPKIYISELLCRRMTLRHDSSECLELLSNCGVAQKSKDRERLCAIAGEAYNSPDDCSRAINDWWPPVGDVHYFRAANHRSEKCSLNFDNKILPVGSATGTDPQSGPSRDDNK